VTEEQHREVSILASMTKGGAAEMDPVDDARKFLSDSLGVGAMQRHFSAEKYHKVVVDGGMQVQQDGGVPFLSNIVNKGSLAQALFIAAGNIYSSFKGGWCCPPQRRCLYQPLRRDC
jgi:hypothetical protein